MTENCKFQNILENLLNLNFELETNILKETKFKDKLIENKFQSDRLIKEKTQNILSDIILILGYISSLLYIFFAYYREVFVVICLLCKILTILFMVLKYLSKDKKITKLVDHVEIFLLSLSLSIKATIISLAYNNPQNDNSSELLRIIIYYFVSINLFILFKFEANIFIYLFYFSNNFVMIIISHLTSNSNHFYFLEALTSFICTFIFFSLRKVWDYRMRIIFSEKYKFERYYSYTIDFITGLNSFHINISNNQIIYLDKKLENLLNNLIDTFPDLKELDFNKPNQNLTIFEELNNTQEINNENNIFFTSSKSLKNSQKNDNFLKNFTNYLIPFKDENIKISNFVNNDLITGNNKINNKENSNLFDNSLYNYINNYRKNQNLLEKNDYTPNNNNFLNFGVYTFKDEKIKKYFEVFYRRIDFNKSDEVYDILFYDISDLILSKIIINEENVIKQKVLSKIAHEFKTPINSILGLINIIKENLFNKKESDNNCLKIINDTNLIEKLSEKSSKKNLKILNIIQNLSKYVIFLVSDIIQYSNLKEISQIKLNIDEIKMKELGIFSIEILKCLLKCNKLKSKNVKTEFIYDNEIDDLVVKTDEIRLIQILLNFISNSVKFTKIGKIKICFKYDSNLNNIIITVEDSGIGIREEDKERLFKDFVMLDNGISQNIQGTGLGLSICKTLANKMDMKIRMISKYGEGTSFMIFIPVMETNKKRFDFKISNEINKKVNNTNREKEIRNSNNIKKEPTFSLSSNNICNLNILENNAKKKKTSNDRITNLNKLNDFSVINEEIKSINDITVNNSKLYDMSYEFMNLKIINNILKLNVNSCVDEENSSNFENIKLDYVENSGRVKSLIKNSNFLKYNKNNNEIIDLFNENEINLTNSQYYDKNKTKLKKNKSNRKFYKRINSDEDMSFENEVKLEKKKNKILIVDDNQFINDSCKKVIENFSNEYGHDFEIIQCVDGIDMIKLVIEDQNVGNLIKCILTDENMEYINGSEAIQILKKLEKKNKIKELKYISITCQEDIMSMKLILESGADLIIPKPITKNVIAKKFKDLKIV